ncbi:SPOR domain-containing protein [Lusitaniella coriacea]|uniref:SPOR domain-containing protein n=1 Tax=Lusitaniella coriacea TaxID=1983105 RepID=UPI003CFB7280
MGRHSSVDASESPAINPVLASALGSMDVQLEQELARYRRKRSQTESPNRPQDSYPQLSISSAIAQGSAEGLSLETLGENAAILPLPSQAEAEPESETTDPKDANSLQSSLIASQEAPSEKVADPPSLPPDDYLESSEQLLRNLEKEEPPQPKTPSPTLAERLLTPLGIGSILLLFGTATLVGAALLDPEMVSSWSVARLFNGKKSPSGDRTPTIAGNPEEEGPKLETDEFVELDLDTLSTIEPSPAASPNSNPAQLPPANNNPTVPPVTLPESDSNLTRALIPPTQFQQTAPSPTTPNTAPPVPTKITPAPAPSAGDRLYYAIADYTGPESLQQVQAAIPDAYVRNFGSGTSIQLGAFLTEEDAQRLAEKLKQEGISTSVYHR